MRKVLAILLLAASQAFAQNSIGNVSNNGGIVTIGQSGGVTGQTVTVTDQQHSGSWNVPAGAVTFMRIAEYDANTPVVISNYGRAIIIHGMTCTRYSTVQAETICTPNKEIRQ